MATSMGRDMIDEDIKGAAIILAKVWLTSGPVDDGLRRSRVLRAVRIAL